MDNVTELKPTADVKISREQAQLVLDVLKTPGLAFPIDKAALAGALFAALKTALE